MQLQQSENIDITPSPHTAAQLIRTIVEDAYGVTEHRSLSSYQMLVVWKRLEAHADEEGVELHEMKRPHLRKLLLTEIHDAHATPSKTITPTTSYAELS